MGKLLQVESTLTDRYQTTIPEPIRESLHLNKRDKITYTLQENGKVIISRANEDDPILSEFLDFLATDIKSSKHVSPLTSELLTRANNLIRDVEIDLDAPLNDEDE